MTILDHVGFAVSDFDRAVTFYRSALASLGIEVVMTVTQDQSGGYAGAGFGRDRKPFFWIGTGDAVGRRVHVAFAAERRSQVDAFHAAALAAGATGNGAPGLRPHYHPNYYGAFVLDFDGNNIEAVCHGPEGR